MKFYLFISIAISIIFVGCSSPAQAPIPTLNAYCPILEVSTANKLIQSNWSEFQDEVNIADNAPRISLPPIIEKLQSIRSNSLSIIVPKCMETMKQFMIETYNAAISAFLNFMGGAEADTSQVKIYVQKFTDEANRLADCIPNCHP